MAVPTPRALHYAEFYGLTALRTDVPIVLLHGNCQVAALRVLLDGADLQAVRVPPVFELTADDVPPLLRLLARADLLVAQPVRDGYAGLPLGTRELAAALRPGTATVVVPIVRWTGLHPFAAIIRNPADRSEPPPLVPYHDLRTVAEAAGRPFRAPSPAVLRELGELSREELRRREIRDCDVRISDVFDQPQAGDMLTLNHPGNRVLLELAGRVRAAVGWAPVVADPGRVLLGEVIAPVEDATVAALELPARGPALPDSWQVTGTVLADRAVHAEQLNWYGRRPGVVAEGLRRHAQVLRLLGAG